MAVRRTAWGRMPHSGSLLEAVDGERTRRHALGEHPEFGEYGRSAGGAKRRPLAGADRVRLEGERVAFSAHFAALLIAADVDRVPLSRLN
jgi:hypothetical protein